MVFVPAEEVGELVVEIRRGSVEIAEFLQEIGRGHGDGARGALTEAKRSCVEYGKSRSERLRRARAGVDDLEIGG